MTVYMKVNISFEETGADITEIFYRNYDLQPEQ